MEHRLRLGQFVMERRGAHFEEIWNDGYAFVELNKKLQAINAEREEIARASQLLRKRKPAASAGASSTSSGGSIVASASSVTSKKQQSGSQASGTQVAAASASVAATGAVEEFAKPEPPKE